MVFAEWMAQQGGKMMMAYHASLTRAGTENDSCDHFRQMVHLEYRDRFVHITWEDLFGLCDPQLPRVGCLRGYLETKTAGLRQAFRLGTEGCPPVSP
jgi:hypothetical protein